MPCGSIGLFDSGVGGLTVLREVLRQAPESDTIYLADDAHCPYGPRPVPEIRAISAEMSQSIDELLGPTSGATVWVTATPFVPPRHIKRAGRSSLIGQVQAELLSRGFPPAEVEVLAWDASTLPLRNFVRRRQKGPHPPMDLGVPLRLRFQTPVHGPICLGYGSHFGLGRIRPETGSDARLLSLLPR